MWRIALLLESEEVFGMMLMMIKLNATISIPEIIQKLSAKGIPGINHKNIVRDMDHLSTLYNIACDDNVRPFQ